jgi:hypothetical protein
MELGYTSSPFRASPLTYRTTCVLDNRRDGNCILTTNAVFEAAIIKKIAKNFESFRCFEKRVIISF